MRKNTLITAVAVGVLAGTAAGCGGPTAAGDGGGANGPKKGPYTIGLSTFFQGNSWQAETVQVFNDACKAAGKDVIKRCVVQNANNSTSQQIAQIQGMINQKVDAILVDANSSTGLNAVVKRAMSAGIKVINYNSIITGAATSKINTDQSKWGNITGKWLIDRLNGTGKIIVLNGVAGNPTNAERYAGAKKLFAKAPGIRILQTVNADWDQAKAQAAVSRLLNAYPKIDGVWSQGGAMTAGAMIEFQKAHRPLVPMTGEDYNGFLKLWSQNTAKGFSSISPGQPNYLATISLQAALRSLKGQRLAAKVDVPLPVVTDKNLASTYRADKSPSFWVHDKLPQKDIDKLLTGS